MPAAPKRKKLEKDIEPAPDFASSQRFYCCRCGTAYSRIRGYFPVSHSPMYRGTGFLPICGNCVEDLYQYYRKKLGNDKEAIRRVCMKLDLYWNEDIYAMAEKSAGVHSRIKNYIGKTNIIHYLDKNFDDTLEEEASAAKDAAVKSYAFGNAADDDKSDMEGVPKIDQATIDFWGVGFDPDVYEEFNRRYQDWTEGRDVSDPSERSLYKQICILETTISRDAAQGKAIDKNVNALNTLLGSMNLRPIQKREDGDADLDKMPLGVGIQKWEFSRPLPPTEKKLCDITGTIKNITTWYLGHACKMVGLRNSYCRAYEEAIEELRVKHPEEAEEDDDTFLSDLFSEKESEVISDESES